MAALGQTKGLSCPVFESSQRQVPGEEYDSRHNSSILTIKNKEPLQNILELKVYDENAMTKDDLLFTVLFDVAKIQLGETVRLTFQLNPKSREISCLEVLVDNRRTKKEPSEKDFLFSVKGSYEASQTLSLGSSRRPVEPLDFHYMKYSLSELRVALAEKPHFCSDETINLHVKSNDWSRNLDVRLEFDLCMEEKNFLQKRRKFVASALKKALHLEQDLQDHEVPVVAVMTTGGGTRALTSLLGNLLGLQKLDLLDAISYITGSSGSTWTLSHLYQSADWSHKDLSRPIGEVRRHMTKCKLSCFSLESLKYYDKELKLRKQEGYQISSIDFWGLLLEKALSDGKNNHKLSDERQALNQGQNPLPIYMILNIKEDYSLSEFKEWVEFTPYEVGFLKYGAFIRAEDFGSEFFMGRLMKKLPESRICFMKEGDEPSPPARNHELETYLVTPECGIMGILRQVLTERVMVSKFYNFLKGFQVHNEYLQSKSFCIWKDTVLENFPNQLTETAEFMCLADTAGYIDISYPPLMRPERKVDVVLHLNYSSGSQASPLEEASKYFLKQGIPFPKIHLSEEEKRNLKECYIFEDAETPEAPTVVFFPLVNDTFRKYKEPGVNPANMSQELLPMEVPEALYYMNPGKFMMPSNAKVLQDEDSDIDSLGDDEPQEENEESIVPDKGDFKIESSPCYLLTVRIIRMRNLQRVDALSQADCYVSLWLPTATCEKSRTKTVRNSNNPVWNETFYFRIQSRVKNMLELTVYDEDFATPDDHLLCALFDIAKLPIERTVLLCFKPSPKAKEELEVEFKLEAASGPHEAIATNGVLVCRELCCLEVEVAEKMQQKSKKELSLTVKGSFEGTQDITLGPDGVASPSGPTKFHYIKYAEPTLDVMLPKKRRYHPWTCKYSTETGSPVVMLNSLPMGRKTTIAEVPVVAIITTGGGLKSMTGLYGSLMGLKKLNLLDCVTYISGLSGTTWTMANLYRDAYWSQKDLDSHIGEAQKQATKCKMGCFSMDRMKYYNKQLCQRKEEGYRTSFIDLWGLMIEYLLNDGKDPHKLSEQQEALCDGQNPLPIYVSVSVRDNYSTNDFKEWVEFTPYEVGLLKYGAFVRTEHFGNEDPVLPTRPHELRTRMYTPPGPLSSALRGALTDRFSVAQHHNFLKGYQLHNNYLENEHFCRWKDTVLDSQPNQLMQNSDHLGMIDAGFFINTSSPPLLRPQREVDVIIYLSYTTGSHTSSLDKAYKYYSEQKIPFPKISLTDEDKKNLKECYIFQDSDLPGCPIVIFLPLVNDTFREYKAPVSQTDCYVSLWLPTASTDKFQTKTIKNCKDPVWNETFYFRIQSQVKNVLELALYDKDVVTQDDHLFTVYFDIAKLSLGEQVFMHFKCDSQRQEELEVGFTLDNISGPPETIITNGVLVCSRVYDTGSPNVELHSLPSGKNMILAEDKGFDLYVKAEDCPDHLDVRLGFDLCVQEQDFLCKRQKYVAPALKKVLQLEQDLLDHETPVVAIMTTGGGMRSLTALYGSLRGLKKLNILDCATYLTGLSGTTWTMSNLYRDADWSQKDLDKQISEARKHMTKCKINSLSLKYLKYYKKQLCQRKREGRKTSFIDLWGLVLESLLHDGKDNHRLSDQQRAIDRGQNPLPIYTAVNVKNNYSTLDFKEWVEFTPYEVGLQKYGAFVRVEDFGSEFFMGRLMKKVPESRICFLEEEEPILPLKLHELRTRLFTPPGPLGSALRSALTDRLCIAQEHNFLKGFQMHNDYLENKHFCRWKDTVLDTFPNQLTQSEEFLSLVDTGFFINTSVMPLLKPERKVDVILHLNYSAGSQIQALDHTCKYCSEQGILFPRVDLSEEDRKNLKECYLFDGAETPGAPLLLFFPLINDTFQKYKAPGQKRSESEMEDGKVDLYGCCSPYSTYSIQYTEKAYDRLVQLGEYNILNNEDLIMQALHTAVARKRQKKK
ncbi:cytosolic phospholipase A2 epsilon [Grus japonensis]|uniref:Phospholipase A2 n=1 Tax=Grus japonensis TaxID=30415 RepID=A0ABC9WYG3_GRUJA